MRSGVSLVDSTTTTPPPFHVVPLLDGTCAVEPLLDFTATNSVNSALRSLCMTIGANRAWHLMEDVRLVARSGPAPLLAVFGGTSVRDIVRLEALCDSLREVVQRHTFVGYADAERAARRLADMLTARYGIDEVQSWTFAAIPRGGMVVMGMLAYILDLDPDQICIAGTGQIPEHFGTLCIVDDCALSGIRLRGILDTVPFADPEDTDDDREYPDGDTAPNRGRIVFCPLYAPADLCDSLEQNEPRVEACICAHSLEDLAPGRLGNAYPVWYAARSSAFPEAYWIGIPEYVAFAWHEPDSRAWNRETGEVEHGWYLAPAERCLSSRLRLHLPEWSTAGDTEALFETAAELIHGGSGAIRAAEGVVWSPTASALQIARITPQDDARPGAIDYFELSGSAIAMWHAVIRHGTVDGCVEETISQFQGDRETICRDVESLLGELAEFGLLEFHSPHDPTGNDESIFDESIPDSKVSDPMDEGTVS